MGHLGIKQCQVFFIVAVFCPDLRAELQLDWLKGTRGGVKRVLFLDSQQPQRTGLLRLGHSRPRSCLSYIIYLRVSWFTPCGQALFTELWLQEESATLIRWTKRRRFCLFLQEEDEFRDKLTPISLALNYSLAPPSHDQALPPVLNQYSSTFLQEQVDIFTVQ